MMTPIQQVLWGKLRQFQFDPPDALVTLADKIAREQGWTATFTELAIDEYRRFLILAKSAGHPVSPSETVDIVWHWHLLYTRSYWDDLCDGVLEMRLHHEPSTGGPAESAKFDDCYARTLASYRAIFGQEAPADIWPLPVDRDDAAPFARKIDTRRYWLIPRTGSIWAAATAIALLAVLFFSGGWGPAAPAVNLNPLDLPGPKFLSLYAGVAVAVFVIAWFLRHGVRSAGDGTLPSTLDPYEAAYLNGGEQLAVSTAVAYVAAQGLITVGRGETIKQSANQSQLEHPLEQAIFKAAAMRITAQQLRSRLWRELNRLQGRLRDQGLIVDPTRAAAVRTITLLLALAVPMLGVMKIAVGLSRDRPVGYLIALTLVAAVIAVAVFSRRIARTYAGDRLLRSMRSRYTNLRKDIPIGAPMEQVSMGTALFGFAALSMMHPLHVVDHSLWQNDDRRSLGHAASSSTGGSSCGGDGGGGSSCGGGGGCGGGCGGCGGS